MRNDIESIHDPIRTFVSAASLRILERGVRAPAKAGAGWREIGDGWFRLHADDGSAHAMHVSARSELNGQAYDAAVSALHAHAGLAPRLGKLVGSRGSAGLVDANRVLQSILYETVRREGFDATAFVDDLTAVVDAFSADAVTWITVAPLSGLTLDTPPIAFEPGLEIVSMSDDEVAACLDCHLLTGFGTHGQVQVVCRSAIRSTESWEMKIAPPQRAWALDLRDIEESDRRHRDRVESVVHLLRLCKDGDVSVPGILTYASDRCTGREYCYTYSPAPKRMEFERYRIGCDDVQPLVSLWTDLQAVPVRDNKQLTAAVRRFGYAGDRARPSDQLVDLVVAAEALFTPGTNSELSHRLALNAAGLLAEAGHDPNVVYGLMKKAYGARSKLVHGTSDGSPTENVKTDASEMTTFMRVAIKRMIALAVQGDAPRSSDEWDRRMLKLMERPRESDNNPSNSTSRRLDVPG